jgi:hypothetical protein
LSVIGIGMGESSYAHVVFAGVITVLAVAALFVGAEITDGDPRGKPLQQSVFCPADDRFREAFWACESEFSKGPLRISSFFLKCNSERGS